MTYPLVTIITPTYNRSGYLAETINSVLAQGYSNLEYIVLDDGSTDNTLSILEQFNGQIIWDKHPNMGEVLTVNKGFSMAHGEIIGVVNSDDPLLPGAVHRIVEFMLNYPKIGVVYPDWDMIDADGKKIDHINTYEYDYFNMLRWHHCLPGPGAFFRREIALTLGGRDPQFRYVSDFDFWLRAGLIMEFARLPQTLATFRVHPTSTSLNQTNEKMAKEHISLIHKIYAIPNLPLQAMRVKREAYSSAYFIAGYVCQSCSTRTRRKYFFKAIMYAPLKYLGEYRQSRLLGVIIPISYPWIKRIFHLVKNPGVIVEAIARRITKNA